jgi:probable HAF family extracellular repeat protein
MRMTERISYLAIVLLTASTCFGQMYSVADLGTLGGSWSQATAINASGQVVGASSVSDTSPPFPVHAFRRAPNSTINPATDDLVQPCDSSSEDYPFHCVASAYA